MGQLTLSWQDNENIGNYCVMVSERRSLVPYNVGWFIEVIIYTPLVHGEIFAKSPWQEFK